MFDDGGFATITFIFTEEQDHGVSGQRGDCGGGGGYQRRGERGSRRCRGGGGRGEHGSHSGGQDRLHTDEQRSSNIKKSTSRVVFLQVQYSLFPPKGSPHLAGTGIKFA